MWTNVIEGMTAYSTEELKTLLDDAGFIKTEIHRMKPSNATIIGVKASFATGLRQHRRTFAPSNKRI